MHDILDCPSCGSNNVIMVVDEFYDYDTGRLHLIDNIRYQRCIECHAITADEVSAQKIEAYFTNLEKEHNGQLAN